MIEGHLIDKVFFSYFCQKNFNFLFSWGDLSPAPACDGSGANGVGEGTKDVSEQLFVY